MSWVPPQEFGFSAVCSRAKVIFLFLNLSFLVKGVLSGVMREIGLLPDLSPDSGSLLTMAHVRTPFLQF